MEIKSLYLEAIQSIAGTTPGEKHKTIHAIARQLAGIESARNNSEDFDNPVPHVPESLKPLVQVEVAKILHRHEGIIEALKSDDPVVVARAVQADWFFDGSNTALVNAKYFRENVIPKISIFARLRMIKSFANNLKNTSVAADFFITIAEVYGVDQALPLLVVCEEEFAFNAIIEKKIVLSVRQVEVLYRKYPNLVIKYLKYGKPEGNDVRNAYSVNIHNYVEFLPELSVKHFEEFMEIYALADDVNLEIKLYNKAVSMFLKTRQNLLVEKPNQYLKLLPLEKVSRKMSHENFLKMFKNLFPKDKRQFKYKDINDILKHYEPAEEKLSLIRTTFREVYGEDLLDDQDLVDYKIMQILPAAERVKIARLKLENDTDWHIFEPSKSWRCYLPTSESIPLITKEIAKSSDAMTRELYLALLVSTCKMNNDNDALLKVMNYFYDRHRNEVPDVFFGFIDEISSSFDLAKLSSAHWKVLKKYIKIVEVQGNLVNKARTMMPVIESAIYYCLLNDLPFDDYLCMFIDMKTDRFHMGSNFFKEYPRFEKKLLELVIEKIPKQYPFDNIKFWENEEIEIINFLTSSLWDFNKRNRKLNSNLNQLSIKNYPWLFNKIKDCIFIENNKSAYDKKSLLESIKENEKDLYDAWLLQLPKFWTFGTNVIYEILRERPQLVFDNWKKCYEEDTSNYYRDRIFIRFIKKSRWYQYLPINIFNEALKMCKNSVKATQSMFLLASLGDGESYTKIIEPFIPADEKMDVEDHNAKKNFEILSAITRALPKVNPPVSLDTIAKFCVGDYLKMAIGSMFAVSSRVPVSDVMPFIKTLMDRRVSVKKHGIRLICSVAPLEEIYAVLTDLWKTENHTSIRNVIFNKVYTFFPKQADSRSWCLLQMCLNGLNTDDDVAIFQNFSKLPRIPNEYIYDYIKTALDILKSMEDKSHDKKPFIKISCDLIKSIDRLITDILPEEYCQKLIKEYLFTSEYHEYIFDAGLRLSLDSYLLVPGNHYESRYKFFEKLFRDTVQKYWDKPDTKTAYQYPTKLMINKFFNRLICKTSKRTGDLRVTFETFLKIFESVLQPQQDATSYLGLVYSILFYKSNNSVEFAEMTVQKVPELIEIFSPELIILISEELSDFLRQHEFDELQINQEKTFNVIQIFANSGSIHCALIAAHLLLRSRSNVYDEQYQIVVQTLGNFDHPGISALINKQLIKQSNPI